jgi:hypothetical protein
MTRMVLFMFSLFFVSHYDFAMEREQNIPQPQEQGQEQIRPEQLLAMLQAMAQVQNCAICQDSLVNESPEVALACTHRFHKPCLEKFYKSQLLAGQNTLQCPLCRQEITAEDRAALELELTPDDMLSAQWNIFLNSVGSFGIPMIQRFYNSLVNDEGFFEFLRESTDVPEGELRDLLQKLRSLTITEETLGSGEFAAAIQNICNGATQEDLIALLHAGIVYFQIRPEMVQALIVGLVQQRPEVGRFLPLIMPTLRLYDWIVTHRPDEMPDLSNNGLARIATRIKPREALTSSILNGLKCIIKATNTGGQALENAPYFVLIPAAFLAQGLYLLHTHPEETTELLRSAVHDIFPLPTDERNLRTFSEGLATLLLERRLPEGVVSPLLEAGLNVDVLREFLRSNSELFEHFDTSMERLLLQQSTLFSRLLQGHPRIEEDREASANGEAAQELRAAVQQPQEPQPADLDGGPELRVRNAHVQPVRSPQLIQAALRAEPGESAQEFRAAVQQSQLIQEAVRADRAAQQTNTTDERLVSQRSVQQKQLIAAFISGILMTIIVQYMFN